MAGFCSHVQKDWTQRCSPSRPLLTNWSGTQETTALIILQINKLSGCKRMEKMLPGWKNLQCVQCFWVTTSTVCTNALLFSKKLVLFSESETNSGNRVPWFLTLVNFCFFCFNNQKPTGWPMLCSLIAKHNTLMAQFSCKSIIFSKSHQKKTKQMQQE